jgi:hypothetical protein
VIRDCAQDSDLDGHYSQRELEQARRHLPTDIDEYTDCRDLINSALAGGGGGSGGGFGAPADPSLTTPAGAVAKSHADIDALNAQAKSDRGKSSGPQVRVAGNAVTPGGGHALFKTAGAANGLPRPLLFTLIAVGLLATAGLLLLARRGWPATRRVASRILRR